MEPEINNNENNAGNRVYNYIEEQPFNGLGLGILLQRDLLIRAQQQQQLNQANEANQRNKIDSYKDLDGETDVESFVNILAEKHGVSHRKAIKIIAKINDKKSNPDHAGIMNWIKGIYDKAGEYGAQEQRAVFNILQEKNWTDLLKEKEKNFNFTNKIAKKWKFSKEELTGQAIESVQKVYGWYETATKYAKFIPTPVLGTVMQYGIKLGVVAGLLALKYKNNNDIVNNKALFEMIESFKSKSNKKNAYWLKENLDKFKENFPNRSFNNQKQFMTNVKILYGNMDFNTKRMFASTDPIVVINLMDEAARKVKFKLFDKKLDEEKIKEFHHEIMALVIDKMKSPEFRNTMITQNVSKDKKDMLEILKVFEVEKRNFILDGISKWNETTSSYRLSLEKTRDDLHKVRFALAGNVKAQEYVEKVFEKIDRIDNFFLEIERENNPEIFSRAKGILNLFKGHGSKPLNQTYQDKFDQLNVRELDTFKNHLEYALKDNDEAKKSLVEVFDNLYNFKPQSNIEAMKNKWEVSLAVVNKNMKEFNEKTDKSIFDYIKQGVSFVSSGVYKLSYAGSKLVDSIKNKQIKGTSEVLINTVSLGLKGVGLLVEVSTKALIEKTPEWYIKIENKIRRADKKIIDEYGMSTGQDTVNDLDKKNAFILKGMLIENIKLVEKNREEKDRSRDSSNSNNTSPRVR